VSTSYSPSTVFLRRGKLDLLPAPRIVQMDYADGWKFLAADSTITPCARHAPVVRQGSFRDADKENDNGNQRWSGHRYRPAPSSTRQSNIRHVIAIMLVQPIKCQT
jgi:hypothetical protein